VSLAGITDLRSYSVGSAYCNASVAPLLGGTPAKVPERYAQTSPIELLPLGVPQRLLHGVLDRFVPVEQSLGFARRAKEKGDNVEVELIEGAGHFDLIAPFAPAWTPVEQAVVSLLSLK
jgi:dipeptidyl aminopeptidase/acylaminoacyl peptidase